MGHWESVFSTTEHFEAERIKNMLTMENIPCVILNQKDSWYPMLGELNIMVSKEYFEKAKNIINNGCE